MHASIPFSTQPRVETAGTDEWLTVCLKFVSFSTQPRVETAGTEIESLRTEYARLDLSVLNHESKRLEPIPIAAYYCEVHNFQYSTTSRNGWNTFFDALA